MATSEHRTNSYISNTTSLMRKRSRRAWSVSTSTSSRKRTGGSGLNKGEPSDLGQSSDKKEEKWGKVKVIYVGQALNS